MQYVEFKSLETERLILRDIRMEDIQEYYERLWGDGDVCRYLLHDPHQDIGESLAAIEDILQQYAASAPPPSEAAYATFCPPSFSGR